MRVLNDHVSRRTAWKIAMEHGWDTTLDAEYLAVTRLQADAFVTVNQRQWRPRPRGSSRWLPWTT